MYVWRNLLLIVPISLLIGPILLLIVPILLLIVPILLHIHTHILGKTGKPKHQPIFQEV